jgi:hypothetical protein
MHAQTSDLAATCSHRHALGKTAGNEWKHFQMDQMDQNTAFTPITLTISHQMHASGTGLISDMITAWCQEQDMRAVLLDAPLGLCLHI